VATTLRAKKSQHLRKLRVAYERGEVRSLYGEVLFSAHDPACTASSFKR